MTDRLPTADDIRTVAEQFDPAAFEPHIKRAADALYGIILEQCEGYLRENVDYNIGASMAMLNYDNQKMRTELFEVDKALGCLSLGHEARLCAIRETHERWRQASNENWRLRERVAVIPELVGALEAVAEKGVRSMALYQRIRAAIAAAQGIEARQGGDAASGSVHESPVGNADAPADPPTPTLTMGESE